MPEQTPSVVEAERFLADRCPRCKRIDYLPLPDLKARCLRCGTTYQRVWKTQGGPDQ